MADFRFPKIAAFCGWEGPTGRNGSKCDAIKATCFFLRRLAFPCRWRDLELKFRMRRQVMGEICWEIVASLHDTQGHLVTSCRTDIFQDPAALYANAFKERGGALDNCVGFIDGTKIQMCRHGGPDANQRANYSGHKRID